MTSSVDVLVVGGGPAGLTAAWEAAATGRSVRLVERSAVLGGMAASVEVAGQRVDLGSHRLHPVAPPAVLTRLEMLLGTDLQRRRRNGRLRLGNRWIRFPLATADLVRALPPRFAAAAALDTATAPLRRPAEDTFAEVVRARLGPTMLGEFYGPYARKLWGTPPEHLAGELARRRISAGGGRALAAKAFQGRTAPGRWFLYPRRGYGQIVEALGNAAVGCGAELRTATTVRRLAPAADRAVVALDDGTDVEAAHVLWTAPLPALVAVADPGAPPEVVDAGGRLRHRAVVCLYLVVPRPSFTAFDAHYLPAADLLTSRLSEPKNYRTGPDPEDHTVLCAELPCWVGDDTWTAEPGDLAGIVGEELRRCGLPDPTPVAVDLRRLPAVYPVLDREATGHLATVDRWAGTLDRVTVLGRPGLFVPDNLHHVMAMAIDAVQALAPDGRRDDEWWSSARRRFAGHVVQD